MSRKEYLNALSQEVNAQIEWIEVYSDNFQKIMVRAREVPPFFWDLWRREKAGLKECGFFIKKEGDRFSLYNEGKEPKKEKFFIEVTKKERDLILATRRAK